MNDQLIKIYNYPLGRIHEMTIRSRCEIQRDIIEILKSKKLEGKDRENMQYHHDRFIDDILMIASKMELSVVGELATIMTKVKNIQERIDGAIR